MQGNEKRIVRGKESAILHEACLLDASYYPGPASYYAP